MHTIQPINRLRSPVYGSAFWFSGSMNAPVSQRSLIHFLAFAAGGFLSMAGDRAISRRNPTHRTVVYAAGLVGAAVVYPISHLGRTADSAVLIREWIAVLAAAAVYAGASVLSVPGAAGLTAGGWLAHAVFDRAHDRGASSRLPQWYPALCAGYDVGVAALLCVSSTRVPSRKPPRGRPQQGASCSEMAGA